MEPYLTSIRTGHLVNVVGVMKDQKKMDLPEALSRIAEMTGYPEEDIQNFYSGRWSLPEPVLQKMVNFWIELKELYQLPFGYAHPDMVKRMATTPRAKELIAIGQWPYDEDGNRIVPIPE